MDWIQQYGTAITALAAGVSAIATVAIAALTASTFALYRLERERQRGRTGSLAGYLTRLFNHFRTSGDLLEDAMNRNPQFTGHGKKAVAMILDENERQRDQIEDLFDRAASTNMEVMAALDTTLALLHAVRGVGEVIVGTSGGSKDLEKAGRQMIVELRDIARALQKGYIAVPSASRRWAGGKRDYHEVLDEFMGPPRDRMIGNAGRDTNGA